VCGRALLHAFPPTDPPPMVTADRPD
jgi:hypothetical protein